MELKRHAPHPSYSARVFLFALLFLLLAFLNDTSAKFVVESPSKYAGSYKLALVSVWHFDNDTAANLPNADPSYILAEGEFSSARKAISNRNGSIVLFDSDKQGIYVIDNVTQFQEQNASAVVISTSYAEPGRLVWIFIERYNNRPDLWGKLRIPVFQVINKECQDLIEELNTAENTTGYRGKLTAEGIHNAWIDAKDSWISIVFQIGLILPPLVGIALVLYRFIPRVRYGKLELKLPIVVLALETLGHLLRIVFAIDPMGMRSLYDPFDSLFWFTPHVAVSLICHLIVLFYWNRAMHSFGAVRSLEFLKKYLYILIAVIIALEIAGSVLRSLEVQDGFLYFVQVTYVVTELVVVGFIIYTAVGLFKFFKSNSLQLKQQRAKAKVFKMTKLIIASAVLLAIIVIFSATGLLEAFRHPYTEMLLWWIQCTCLSIIGICETLILKPVKSKSSTATNETPETLKATTNSSASSSVARMTSSEIVSLPGEDKEERQEKVKTEDVSSSDSDRNGNVEEQGTSKQNDLESEDASRRGHSKSGSDNSSSFSNRENRSSSQSSKTSSISSFSPSSASS